MTEGKTVKEQEAEGIVHVPETPGAVAASPRTVEELRKEQEDEWGVYIASAPIDFGGARAFNTGDAVPASHVERYKYDEQGVVAKRSTKAGQAVLESLKPTE